MTTDLYLVFLIEHILVISMSVQKEGSHVSLVEEELTYNVILV